MAKKNKRQKTEHEQTGKERAPNLGQDEAQQPGRARFGRDDGEALAFRQVENLFGGLCQVLIHRVPS